MKVRSGNFSNSKFLSSGVERSAIQLIVACGCGIALGLRLGFAAAKKKSKQTEKLPKMSGFAAYTEVFVTRWSNKLEAPTPRKSDGAQTFLQSSKDHRPTFTTVAGKHSLKIESGKGRRPSAVLFFKDFVRNHMF